MWKILRDSVKGVSHQWSGQPCQDECLTAQLALRAETILLLACADGAGSAELSHVGSQLACKGIIRLIMDEISDCETMPDIQSADVSRWLSHLQDEFNNEAVGRAILLRELATTLLVAVVGEGAAAFFQIGDGAIVVFEDGHYRQVFWPQSGEYANTTNFVTDPRFDDLLAFDFHRRRIDEIALFTDGLQMLALNYGANNVHEPFFSPLFASLRATQTDDELAVPLRVFLDSPELNARTDDDKTLVLATRVQAYGPLL